MADIRTSWKQSWRIFWKARNEFAGCGLRVACCVFVPIVLVVVLVLVIEKAEYVKHYEMGCRGRVQGRGRILCEPRGIEQSAERIAHGVKGKKEGIG